MGLDMYAFRTKLGNLSEIERSKETDIQLPGDGKTEELCYWRKHHDLHGWMHELYQSKGGASPEFNCNTLRLLMEDLCDLEDAIKEGRLPQTTGFFFGNNPPDDDSNAYDLEFIEKAKQSIRDGYAVFYDSWW